MCFGGGQPAPPEVVYVGPSEDDIKRQTDSLAKYEQQLAEQQAQTASQIQAQIDAANAKTANLQSELDSRTAGLTDALNSESAAAEAALSDVQKAKMEAAAMVGANYTPIGAYGVTASVTEAPNAETTQAIKPKKKPKSALKIQPGAQAAAGSGLNIGV